jgi:hypothetical protein
MIQSVLSGCNYQGLSIFQTVLIESAHNNKKQYSYVTPQIFFAMQEHD